MNDTIAVRLADEDCNHLFKPIQPEAALSQYTSAQKIQVCQYLAKCMLILRTLKLWSCGQICHTRQVIQLEQYDLSWSINWSVQRYGRSTVGNTTGKDRVRFGPQFLCSLGPCRNARLHKYVSVVASFRRTANVCLSCQHYTCAEETQCHSLAQSATPPSCRAQQRPNFCFMKASSWREADCMKLRCSVLLSSDNSKL